MNNDNKAVKRVSIMEYIVLFDVGVSRQGVLWRIKNGGELPHVLSMEMIGRAWIFTVEVPENHEKD